MVCANRSANSFRRQRADEVFPEGVEEAAQHAGVVRFGVVLVPDDVPKQARALGQLDGEGFGGKRLGQGKIEEAFEQGGEFLRPFNRRRRLHLVEHQGTGGRNRLLPYPVAVQAELQKVGEQQIREGRPVALQLLGILNVVQPLFGRPLGLDVADDAVRAIPQPEIRIAALGRLGQWW